MILNGTILHLSIQHTMFYGGKTPSLLLTASSLISGDTSLFGYSQGGVHRLAGMSHTHVGFSHFSPRTRGYLLWTDMYTHSLRAEIHMKDLLLGDERGETCKRLARHTHVLSRDSLRKIIIAVLIFNNLHSTLFQSYKRQKMYFLLISQYTNSNQFQTLSYHSLLVCIIFPPMLLSFALSLFLQTHHKHQGQKTRRVGFYLHLIPKQKPQFLHSNCTLKLTTHMHTHNTN